MVQLDLNVNAGYNANITTLSFKSKCKQNFQTETNIGGLFVCKSLLKKRSIRDVDYNYSWVIINNYCFSWVTFCAAAMCEGFFLMRDGHLTHGQTGKIYSIEVCSENMVLP